MLHWLLYLLPTYYLVKRYRVIPLCFRDDFLLERHPKADVTNRGVVNNVMAGVMVNDTKEVSEKVEYALRKIKTRRQNFGEAEEFFFAVLRNSANVWSATLSKQHEKANYGTFCTTKKLW